MERYLFDRSEYRDRIIRLQEMVCAAGLDAYIVRTDANIMYLNAVDFYSAERKVLMVVPRRGEPTLIVPRMETEHLASSAATSRITTYWEMDARPGRGWVETLQATLGNVKAVGIEPRAEIDLVTALEGYDWRVSPLIEDLRLIKSAAEVGLIKKVAAYWTRAMNRTLAKVRSGIPVPELVRTASEIAPEVFQNEDYADHFNTSYTMALQCPPDSGSPHHFSMRADQILPSGPTILNSVGYVSWYCAENERTILVNPHTPQHAELFDISQRGQQLALDQIKPGVRCAEVDQAVQAYFEKEGVAQYMRHRAGHGFGMSGHERPYTSEGSADVYRANMFLSVEPGLYVEEVGGFRHCDTVWIKEDGIEILTLETPKLRESLTFT
jgi:Xaa-Pro aminopeptidase